MTADRPQTVFECGVDFTTRKLKELSQQLEGLSPETQPYQYFTTLDEFENRSLELSQLERRHEVGLV